MRKQSFCIDHIYIQCIINICLSFLQKIIIVHDTTCYTFPMWFKLGNTLWKPDLWNVLRCKENVACFLGGFFWLGFCFWFCFVFCFFAVFFCAIYLCVFIIYCKYCKVNYDLYWKYLTLQATLIGIYQRKR